ncbi:hypothetical protein BD769DRAFT_1462155 [Suillus cothurnatus]|nr:hypothetical protein BD769DRAFT_1462155 [Suillus cothurnatus]
MWFPGASFKRNAQIWKAKIEEFVTRPYKLVKNETRKGTARTSFVCTLLEPPKPSFDAYFDSTTNDDDDEVSFTSPSDRDPSFSSDNTKDTATNDHDIRWTTNSMYSASTQPSRLYPIPSSR